MSPRSAFEDRRPVSLETVAEAWSVDLNCLTRKVEEAGLPYVEDDNGVRFYRVGQVIELALDHAVVQKAFPAVAA